MFNKAMPTSSLILSDLLQVGRQRPELLIATICISILSLAFPITLMQVYDRIITNKAVDTLSWLLIGCLVALSIETALRVARAFISALLAARYEHVAGCDGVDKILQSRVEGFGQKEPSIYLDRLNAVGTLRSFYAGQVFQLVMDLPFALLFLIAVFYLGGALVLVPLGVMVLFITLVTRLNKHFECARSEQIDIGEQRMSIIMEILERIHIIKAISVEEVLLRRYENLQTKGAHNNMEVDFLRLLPTSLGAMFSQIAIFGTIGFGAGQVTEGALTVGTLTACSLLSARAMQPIQYLASFFLRFSEANIARSHYDEIMELESIEVQDLPAIPPEIEGRVELYEASFRYDPSAPFMLQNISLVVPVGKMVAIHGASLSGTSTLLHLMMGLIQPTSGKVLIDGFDLGKWDCRDMEGRIAYIPQTTHIFKGTLFDNITMFDDSQYEAGMGAAALVGLDKLVASLPQGFETDVSRQSETLLATGLIQRLALARALVRKPRLLLLDKANAAMDQSTQEDLKWLLRNLKGQCTIVMVSNQPNFLKIADDVYELTGGGLETSVFLELLADMQELSDA
jgi:ATP-binding cassette subfamily C protein LapB